MNELRELLPVLDGMCYLNYGATSPILKPAADVLFKMVQQSLEPLQFHRDEWIEALSHARELIAELIGASTEEIAFVTNTSHGLSLIANGIRWRPGDRVLYPFDEFPSNRFVWENLREKGVRPEAIVPVPGLPFSKQLASLDLSHVRLVSFSAISYLDGRRHDIENIVKLCHSHGILVCVDAIQAIGAIPYDVHALGCDFLSCGGRKWIFGPAGSGFLYIKKERLEELFVSEVGWHSAQNVNFEAATLEFAHSARRFEPGLLDIPAIAAMGASVDAMKKIGWEKIYQRIAALTKTIRGKWKDYILTPAEHGGIISLQIQNAADIQKKLLEQNIIVTQRGDKLRLCIHASVLDEELGIFSDALSRLI